MPREGQNGHRPDHKGQVKEVNSHVEAAQQQGGADGEEAPRPGQEEQEGVVEAAQDEGRGGQDESDQRGGQPGVQRQRGHEERHDRLAHRCSLPIKRANRDRSIMRFYVPTDQF